VPKFAGLRYDGTMNEVGLRERARLAIKADISKTAMDMFLTQGFEATTVDEIAKRVGVSRRSLFRYFTSKEEMAAADIAVRGDEMLAALKERPTDESPWEALYAAAFSSDERGPTSSRDRTLQVAQLLRHTPALQRFRLEKQKRWQDLLAPEIALRIHGDGRDIAARGIVATALACLDASVDIWVESGGEGDVLDVFLTMIAAVRG